MLDTGLTNAVKDWQQENAVLTVAFWFHAVLAVLALAAMPFDHRLILGLSPWVKPLKFDLSTMIFILTVAVLLRALGPKTEVWPRVRRVIAWVVGWAMIIENTIISTQSLRGVRSHMNYSTVLDGSLFALMGNCILLSTLAMATLLSLWCICRPTAVSQAALWGVRLGLVLFVAGSIEGVLMVKNGGHTVGAPDGGPGMFFVNWSTGHGDLRIAHFLALHALQLMPLIGLAVARLRLPSRAQITAVCVVCAGYVAIVWLLFRAALQGKPLIG